MLSLRCLLDLQRIALPTPYTVKASPASHDSGLVIAWLIALMAKMNLGVISWL